jgi:hypothetical protein
MTVFLVFAFSGLDRLFAGSSPDRLAVVENAIRRAAVQCYALEGSYPPELSYLEEHYGIQLDYSRYDFLYSTFGSNIIPQIKVFEKTSEPKP